ncbi:uncharacterized protein VICG_01509 [Vittaforma corneae ATCC 50505]|uniref:Uncharacterized protein n=1 Tax=Vittaforma corneae (strain ATCC 50505) TaxID=993615 RepID=L2GL85_VITCO|nr:uncharacterized protein VICG_01509 [Vittaforma corneae ATCC 50505]ELA41404.1 hypothetical protein VICG_01509 [Vittaforma corneae ATCC 50505]
MDRTEQENWCDIFKKAKAKRMHVPMCSCNNQLLDEDRNQLLIMLNEELLSELFHIIQINPITNLAELGRIYRQEIRRILDIPESSYSFRNYSTRKRYDVLRDNQENIPKAKSNLRPRLKSSKPCKNENSKKRYTESYLVFGSLFGISPPLSSDDFLTVFLEQNSDVLEEREKMLVHYIQLNDVVKTRGNPINGPRKEDIGMYNRKIFETYSRKGNGIAQDQLVVNVKFFPKYNNYIGHDLILTSDFVQLYKFNGSSKQRLEQSLFIVHQRDSKKKCTIFHSDKIIFNKLEKEQFKYALSKCKRSINILHFETFTLYSAEFLCENAAIRVFNSFFSKNE